MIKIILVILLLIILIIYNFKNNETFISIDDEESFFEKLTDKEKELFKKLANRDFNSEKKEYYKSPYMCLDYADMMIYD